ncbi:DUF1648 domain-containing protein [Alkalihalobacillus trypoxylicola]|uniref:DUF1648 domain-containing protein n=1 Tax=Alkalihalobacillus trypoxylicola TaxID=519424 RepID=A0A161PZN3_9BACI|nr:DUF5808 domain-containing protein [Alkalihalobacillus trypoxylicola]KYG28225.1 hypothetical protein AZF04_10015 [Alkalihalobacillus trypoxylicola]
MNITLIVILSIILLPVALLLTFIPYITRRTESFGVSISEKVYDMKPLQTLRKRYARSMLILTVILVGGFIWAGSMTANEETLSMLFGAIILLLILLSFVIYLKFHNEMKQIKKEANWLQDKAQKVIVRTDFRTHKLNYSNLWFAIPLTITVLTTLLTALFYDRLPNILAMQINFAGEATQTVEKSYRTAFLFPIMQSYLILLFILINTIIAKSKQQLNAENPEKSFQQLTLFRRRWSLFLIFTSTLLTMMFSFMQWSHFYPNTQHMVTIVSLVFTGIILVGALAISFSTGQGGSRIQARGSEQVDSVGRDEDIHWKLGQFYFNPKDPALFLEKRFGVGWTINFARPIAWLLLIAVIAIAAGIPAVLMY